MYIGQLMHNVTTIILFLNHVPSFIYFMRKDRKMKLTDTYSTKTCNLSVLINVWWTKETEIGRTQMPEHVCVYFILLGLSYGIIVVIILKKNQANILTRSWHDYIVCDFHPKHDPVSRVHQGLRRSVLSISGYAEFECKYYMNVYRTYTSKTACLYGGVWANLRNHSSSSD